MIAGLLLAAGESRRMGSPKPLLDWHGRPLVQHQVRELRRGGCDLVMVVLGHQAGRVESFVQASQAQVVYNTDYREGRASSVRAGAQALPGNLDWIVVLGVDQPRPAGVVAAMVKAARQSDASILLPVYQGRHGHPTLFSGRLLAEMAQVQDETLGLRAVVRRHESELRDVPVDTGAVLLDLNTPQDYTRALASSR